MNKGNPSRKKDKVKTISSVQTLQSPEKKNIKTYRKLIEAIRKQNSIEKTRIHKNNKSISKGKQKMYK